MNGSQFNGSLGRVSGLFSALILLVLNAMALGSATNSAVRATTPVSSYQSGLVNSPNPVDQSANLAITGNVGGGKHFRGGIPYRSTTSFGAPLGSTSLDSFLRYSAVPAGQTAYPQNYTPFYSPTRTVTSTSPGCSGVFTPVSPRIADDATLSQADRAADVLSAAEIPQFRASSDELFPRIGSGVSESSRLPYWPASASSDETPEGIQETGNLSTTRSFAGADDPLMTSEEYQRRLQLLLQDLDRVRSNVAQIEEKLDADGTRTLPQPARDSAGQLPPADIAQDIVRLPVDTPSDVTQGIDSENTGLRLYDPCTRSEGDPLLSPVQTDEIRAGVTSPRTGVASPSSLEATLQRISEYTSRLQAPSDGRRAAQSVAEPDARPVETVSPAQTPAQEPLRTYEHAGSVARQQFDQNMAVAAMNMRQGRLDRAAESFARAAVCVPHDPRAHLGKSHALLAVGQYVDSALSLAKAVEFDAEKALKKVDLVEAVGGPDLFVERITQLEERAQGGDASLQFLLAYVYYQMDRAEEAAITIEAARKGAISVVAVARLATAISR